MWEAGQILKPDKPALPDLPRRAWGFFKIGKLTADAKTRDEMRLARFAAWMSDVGNNPEHRSPVVAYPGTGAGGAVKQEDALDRKIEARWKTGRLVCLEGTVKEVHPHTPKRDTFPGVRQCKHTIVLVEWGAVFDYPDSYIPLNPALYANEKRHLGWNLLSEGYQEAERAEQLRLEREEEDAAIDWVSKLEELAAASGYVPYDHENTKKPAK